MFLRNESDFVYAFNAAQDLTALVATYLIEFRRYANGLNGVNVPKEPFTVVLQKIKEDRRVVVTLVSTRTEFHRSPVYYDYEDDNFVEGYGAHTNVSHYTTSSSRSTQEDCIEIPMSVLMLTKEKMVESIKSFAATKNAEIKAAKDEARIRQLQAEIDKIRNDSQ